MKDLIIIGGGQAGLACAYFLRRTNINYLILDNQEEAGGAWNFTWNSLELFSPAKFSSLPGWMMPPTKGEYPNKQEALDYIHQYEERYQFPIERPVQVINVIHHSDHFEVQTSNGTYFTKTLISATGTWSNPHIPKINALERFNGLELHSAFYESPEDIEGQEVLIVGGGNSAAQIIAELYQDYKIHWLVQKEPQFLPEEVDGRYLFDFATLQYEAKKQGKSISSLSNLGDIVQLPKVRDAKALNAYDAYYTDADHVPINKINTILYCTGFKASLSHLEGLNIYQENRIDVKGTASTALTGLWLVGYGNWTGFASATLIGVSRTARQTIKEIEAFLA